MPLFASVRLRASEADRCAWTRQLADAPAPVAFATVRKLAIASRQPRYTLTAVGTTRLSRHNDPPPPREA